MQAENWLSKHNPTHGSSKMSPQVTTLSTTQSWIDWALPRAWLTSFQAARQSQSRSINITQQLCVFVEDYMF